MTTEDIVDRIRKLLRLAEDAGATEAEAAAALERANALLIRHNLSMDAIAVSTGEQPTVGERPIRRAGWAGSWRGSLLGILARHNLCSPFISRQGRKDTVIVVGRPANVDATHAMYDWIVDQIERLATEEWLVVNRTQRENRMPGKPWCPECEGWVDATYRELGRLHCAECDTRVIPARRHWSACLRLDKMLDERPDSVLFNGTVGSLTGDNALHANVGETIRIFFAVGGPNLSSSFHIIGAVFDRVFPEGSLTSPPETNVQTMHVSSGGATVVEYTAKVPGTYTIVDQSLGRMEKGAAGQIVVDRPDNPEIFAPIQASCLGLALVACNTVQPTNPRQPRAGRGGRILRWPVPGHWFRFRPAAVTEFREPDLLIAVTLLHHQVAVLPSGKLDPRLRHRTYRAAPRQRITLPQLRISLWLARAYVSCL